MSWQACPMKKQRENITIIGQGKVGQSLAQLAQKAGYKTELIGRQIEQQKNASRTADLIIIAVNDEAISQVAEHIADAIEGSTIVTHCSGALNSQALTAPESFGALTASCHPLNTFPTLDSALSTFNTTEHGSYLFAEGNQKAIRVLDVFYSSLGFKFKTITKDAKAHYHLACVMACNYLSVLMHTSLDIAESSGLARDEFWLALSPLVHKTLENISNFGSLQSLSGPIARADTQTIAKHVKTLSESQPNALELYCELGKNAVNIALENGSLDQACAQTILKHLN